MAGHHTAFFDAAATVLLCVCQRMEAFAAEIDDYPGCPCSQAVTHAPPVLDDCCDWRCDGGVSHGQLNVHIADVFETSAFPNRETRVHPCAAAIWVARMGITMARCVPTVTESGAPPSQQAQEDSSRILTIDLQASLEALLCCVTDDPAPGRRKRRVQIVGVIPQAQGGCGSYEVQALVEVGQVCSCAPVGS